MARKREKRTPRTTKALAKVSLLAPFDVKKLGSADDPCFGKLYDLSDEACRRCGDIEFCAIAFQSTMKDKRTEIESTSRFKDIELADQLPYQKAISYIRELMDAGNGRVTAIAVAAKKFKVDKNELKKRILKWT